METKRECRVRRSRLCLWKACAVSLETYLSGAEGAMEPQGSCPTRSSWTGHVTGGVASLNHPKS